MINDLQGKALLVGTYTYTNSRGIYRVAFDRNNTKIIPRLFVKADNPSHLALSRNKKLLYAVSESNKKGKISVFHISDKKCRLLSQTFTNGNGLVHVAMDQHEKYLYTVSYDDASIQMFRLSNDGVLLHKTCEVKHSGSGMNVERQERAHTHSVWLTPTEKELCVCDLGIDRLVVYRIDSLQEILVRDNGRSVSFPPGSGPRHMVFHPNGEYAYVLSELSTQLFVFTWDEGKGFELIQSENILGKMHEDTSAAAIRITGDGHFLYVSVRGDNLLAAYRIQGNGTVEKIGTISTHGSHPRDFILSPFGDILLCANKDSNNISLFQVNKQTGELSFSSVIENIPSPAALIIR